MKMLEECLKCGCKNICAHYIEQVWFTGDLISYYTQSCTFFGGASLYGSQFFFHSINHTAKLSNFNIADKKEVASVYM